MSTVFLDGRFVEVDAASVSAFDASVQHGVGLFETMLAVRRDGGAHVIHLHEHIERLAVSSASLGLTASLRQGALGEAVERTAARAAQDQPGVGRWRVRLTITGGNLNMLAGAKGAAQPGDGQSPTLLIHAQPATAYPQEMFERGVMAGIADWKANPLDMFQGHKTLWYWPRLRELQHAGAKKAAEALVFQVTNHLAGGCVSNAFVVKDGRVSTPIARGEENDVAAEAGGGPTDDDDLGDTPGKGAVLPSPVLPGVVRRWVMDWALGEGVEHARRMLTISDVLEADEVFLTNSSWGVLPIVAVEARRIGAGTVGPVSARLVKAWRELIGE
ncbi:MAG: aminotransferase class IV family protein [Phycisphaeraceae bacterium]|nr:aminotransferase class IV family protein [Phycisphaeraceae bacterium]